MTVGSLNRVVDLIRTTVSDYLLVKQFSSDFESEIQNYLTTSTKFYSIFVAIPRDTILTNRENVNEFSVEIFCHAPIQEDRTNIRNVVSDCSLILADLYRDLKEKDTDFEVINEPNIQSENNSRLDWLAGARMVMTFAGLPVTECGIPRTSDYFPIPVPPTPVCADGTAQALNSDGEIIKSWTVKSGGIGQEYINDTAVRAKNSNGDEIASAVSLAGALSVDLDIPDTTYIINYGGTSTSFDLPTLANNNITFNFQ